MRVAAVYIIVFLTVLMCCDARAAHGTRRWEHLASNVGRGGIRGRNFQVGTWIAPIRSSSTNAQLMASCDESRGGWEANNSTSMIDVLEESHQTIHMVEISKYDYECTQSRLLNLGKIALAQKSDVNVYAVYDNNFDDLADYIKTTDWLRSIAGGIANIKGYSVNDFQKLMKKPYLPDDSPGMLPTDVQRYFVAPAKAQSTVRPIEFIPYLPDLYIPFFVLPSFWIGVYGGNSSASVLYSGSDGYSSDRISVAFPLHVENLSDLGTDVAISFLRYSFVPKRSGGKDVLLTLSVNGHEVMNWTANTNGFVESQSVMLTRNEFVSGENVVAFTIGAVGGNFPSTTNKITYLWNVKVHSLNGFDRILGDDAVFSAYRDPQRQLPWREGSVFVARNNSEFRIDTLVDGVMVKVNQWVKPSADPLDPLLESLCSHLHSIGKECWICFWGENWVDGLEIDFSLQVRQFQVAETYGDKVIMWRLENSLYRPEEGIFKQRGALDTVSYDTMAAFPRNTPGSPGWYQMWTVALGNNGTWTLHFADSGVGTPAVHENFEIFLDVRVDGEWVQKHVKGIVTELPHVGSWQLNVGNTTTALRFGMREVHNVGLSGGSCQFRLQDHAGDVVDLQQFFHSSLDERTIQMWKCTNAFFTGGDFANVCTSPP